jgi:hypothetical protein
MYSHQPRMLSHTPAIAELQTMGVMSLTQEGFDDGIPRTINL